jgi:hypothetical protein
MRDPALANRFESRAHMAVAIDSEAGSVVIATDKIWLLEARHDFLAEQAQGIHHERMRNEAAGVEFG